MGTPSANPVWVSCTGGAFTLNFASPTTLDGYTIDWGDGSPVDAGASLPANTILPHNYAVATDTFIVTVTSTNPVCAITGLVVMEKPVNASIQIPIGGVTTTCAPAALQFINSSTDVSATTTFTWNFGDGSPILTFDESNAGQTVTHTYQRGTVNCQTVVTLTAENYCSFGNPTSAQFNPIQIYDIDEADITPNDYIKCWPDNAFTFTNSTVRNCVPQGNVDQRYEYWNFGDYWGLGHDSIIDWTPWPPTAPRTIAYPAVGNYNITLLDSNRCGIDDVVLTISIVNPPTAGVVAPIDSACAGTTLTFNNTSSPGYSYRWNFGDAAGFITTGFGPRTHLYNTPGTYTVTVIAFVLGSAASCRDTATTVVTIFPNPTSSFVLNPSGMCDNITVGFTNTSTGGATWNWNFGNTNTSALENPPDQSYSVGAYTVSLQVQTANNCSRTSTQVVNVYQSPDAAYTVSNACVNSTVSFTDASTALVSDPIIEWDWDFDDGNNSLLANPTHSYLIASSYDVKLKVNTLHCSDSITNPITISPLPIAAYNFGPISGCAPLVSNFVNSSTGAASYAWDFGDGQTSLDTDPSHTFVNGVNDSTFYISLVATTAFGCKDTILDSISVFGKPVANYTNSSVSGCAPIPVNFTNSSLGATSYSWDFGAGQGTSTDVNPSHLFSNTTSFIQSYSVTLIAANAHGCKDTLVNLLNINPQPLFGFSIVPDTGCSTLSVNFPSVAGAVLYEWDFGDGFNSTGSSPSHTYSNTGAAPASYTVQLVATNAFSCKDTTEGVVVIYPSPVADFSLSQTVGCPMITVDLTNASAGAISYVWDFGDGSPTQISGNASHVFDNTSTASAINYGIKLVSENIFGCKDSITKTVTVNPRTISDFNQTVPACPPANITFNNLSQGASSYSWDFGNSQTSNGISPTQLFANNNTGPISYTVQLITNNPTNCRDTSEQVIVVNPEPLAVFAADITSGCPQLPVSFTNSSVGGISYLWDFGDGSATTSVTDPDHTFDNLSTSTNSVNQVKLVVENSFGCKDSVIQNITVFPRTISDFNQTVPNCPPANITFNNLSQGASTYSWDFGNSQTSSGISPTQLFANNNTSPVSYTVQLITNNPSNCRDTSEQVIVVNPEPLAVFAADVTSGCPQLPVSFTNSSVGGVSYLWDFGDGSATTTVTDPSHTFDNLSTSANAVNQVKLVVENSFGCKDSVTQNITVFPGTIADFTAVTPTCAPINTQFNNSSQGATSYAWSFGDSQTSTAINPNHLYVHNAVSQLSYTVQLITSNANSCRDTAEQTILVNPKPIADFSVSQNEGCPQLNVAFINNSSGNLINTWDFGDGSPDSVVVAPSHLFDNSSTTQSVINTVELVVENSFGCKDSTTKPITVFPMITANFTADTPICAPVNVQFFNLSQGAISYDWNLGDGTSSIVTAPVHNYMNNGPSNLFATVVLTATSSFGCTATHNHTYVIFPSPQVNFTASPMSQLYPASTVTLLNSTPNSASFSTNWNFGDGQTSNVINPADHVYATWGTYTISLVVNSEFCSDSMAQVIQIIPPVPVADFKGTKKGCRSLTVNFQSTSQYENTYLWEFGDGNTSNQQNPTHVYNTAGVYDVVLTVTGDGGSDVITGTDSVTVYELPQAAFIASPISISAQTDPVTCTNISVSPDDTNLSYEFDFGDGSGVETDPNPVHIYMEAGEYEISLIATNTNGCVDTFNFVPMIKVEESSSFEVPNAFTPNPNGPSSDGTYDPYATHNDIFHPVVRGVKEYELSIYSRWGELLFESKDTKVGWDGYYRGKLCTQDVYIWKIKATTVDNKNVNKAGDVLLLKP